MSAKLKLPAGWMGVKSRRWLARQARKRSRIVEVGVWKGRTTLVLATYCPGTVWAVDHWQGVPRDPEQHALYAPDLESGENIYRAFCKALRGPIKSGKVFPVRMPSLDAAAHLGALLGRTVDMVFLDGDHSYEGVAADIGAWTPLLRSGGLLCGHDYGGRWEGVRRAVDEAFGDRITVGPKTLWSVEL
jgi:hypothetical protein